MHLVLTLTARPFQTVVEQVTAVSRLCLWLEAYPASLHGIFLYFFWTRILNCNLSMQSSSCVSCLLVMHCVIYNQCNLSTFSLNAAEQALLFLVWGSITSECIQSKIALCNYQEDCTKLYIVEQQHLVFLSAFCWVAWNTCVPWHLVYGTSWRVVHSTTSSWMLPWHYYASVFITYNSLTCRLWVYCCVTQ